MAEIVVGPAVDQVSGYLIPRIGRQLGYLFNYRNNLDVLNKQVKKLVDARERLQQWVDEANRQGREIFSDVHNCLNSAQQLIPETEEFIRSEMEANRGCCNLKLRYQRSKQAKKRVGDIGEKLQEAGRIGDKVSHPPPPPPVIRSSSLIGYEALESRALILNQIMEALRNDDIGIIGVWGMGGVGKTTLVKQVAKQADEDSFFDKVVIAYVSQVPNLANIQGEIASILGLKFDGGEDEARKAARLSESLKKHKKILVILDDIWEKLDLGKIGIPHGDDHRGCKILLTSRRFRLLSKEMGSQKNFHVEHLGEEEAWSLFKKTAGDSVEKLELNSTATMVAKQCAGLPIAIVTVAKALRDEPLEVWLDALRQLTRCIETDIEGIESKIYLNLELSYNRLNNDKAKSLFLLCGLLDYGDTPIDSLLRYGMGLGIFDEGINTLEEAANSLQTVIWNLKGASLLLESGDGDGDKYVRMHDVIRDVARVIASKDPHQFVVKDAVELQQWQMRDGCKNCTRICLKHRDVQKLPESLVCPNLEFFLLNSDNDDPALEIPDTWFDKTKELKVLGMSKMHLPRLPLSLHFLSNLRTLCLEECLIGDTTIIGELKRLQIISFAGSTIKQLPEEMMQLSDLRVLDLRHCYDLRVIPRNVISSLSRLEYLCTGSFIEWEGGGVNNGESNASVSELKHLFCLRYLNVGIPDSELIPQDLVFDNLDRFRISVGTYPIFSDKSSRCLRLRSVRSLQEVNCISKLLKRTEDLHLRDCRLQEVKHALCELDKEGFVELKELYMRDCDGIEYVGNAMEGVPPTTTTAFPVLEELHLYGLYDLTAVWHGPIRMGSFGNLRILRVICGGLKYVIVQPTTQGTEVVFPQLQEMTFSELSDLVSFNSIGTTKCLSFFNHQDAFPRLEVLDIFDLPSIKWIWHNQHSMTGSFSKLKQVSIYSCENLSSVFPSSIIESFLQLEDLKIGSCGVKEILAKENGIQTLPQFVFPILTHLRLGYLKELENFYPGKHTSKWPLLKELAMYNCDKVETLFEDISLKDDLDCPVQPSFFLIEKDAFPSLEVLDIFGMPSIKQIWHNQHSMTGSFSKLKQVSIYSCKNLSSVFPSSVIFLQLEELKIDSCGVKEILAKENGMETLPKFVFPILTHLRLGNLKELENFYPGKHSSKWPSLKELEMYNCDKVETLFEDNSLKDDLDYPSQPSFFFTGKDGFPNLEILKLRCNKGSISIWQGQFSRESFSKLQVLKIQECHDILVAIPCSMFHILHDLRYVFMNKCNSIKEVIQATDVKVETVPQLTTIYLKHLPLLKQLCGFGLDPVLQNLQILAIKKCENLINLLTPSMIKKFLQLKALVIDECNMVKEMVGNEEEQEAVDDIVFSKLQRLILHDLPNLKSFCSVSYIFKFPFLKYIDIRRCPKMDFFCEGGFSAPGLKKVEMDDEELDWEDDLNMAIHNKYMEKNAQDSKASQDSVQLDLDNSNPDNSNPDESDLNELDPNNSDIHELNSDESDLDNLDLDESSPDESDPDNLDSDESDPDELDLKRWLDSEQE